MLDVSINMEKLLALAPYEIRVDQDALNRYVRQATEQVREAYLRLNSNEAFIHTDVVTVTRIPDPLPARCESCGAPPTKLDKFTCDYCGSLLIKLGVR